MKLLLDACIWRAADAELREMGYDVTWVGSLGDAIDDVDVLRLAHEQRRVLITLDKDFGKLSVQLGMPHFGIVRLVEVHPFEHAVITAGVVEQHAEQLARGAIMVIKGPKIRVRKPPEPSEG